MPPHSVPKKITYYYLCQCLPTFINGDWWRYPVSMVLHSGGMHLALNTLALFVIGIECERTYGKFRMLAIYLFSGIGAAFLALIGNTVKPLTPQQTARQ